MPDNAVDRNLVFAVIALQNNFIDQSDLIAAFHTWASDKAQPLGPVLVARGAIKREEQALLEVLVGKHLEKHGGDVHATLGALADAAARDVIRSIDEPEVRNSLTGLHPTAGYLLVETLVPPTAEKRSRYTLTQMHAHGGLGRVWRARDTDLNREVALKEILPGRANEPELRRRFLKEAQVTGQLEHPSIVPVYELARRPEDDQPFYTMRFVRGQTLRQAIAEYHRKRAEGRADPLERPRLLQAFVSICQALAYAHSRGVIHRDLKPDNVVLGGFGEVIVLDWGLAKMVDRPEEGTELLSVAIGDDARTEATHAGQQLGTPAYMAPEQAEGRLDLIDARTDIYGLGAILFEILTGSPPHTGKSIHELIHQIATGETPRARSIEPSVPAALDAICAKAMAKQRTDRYATASELAQDVQRWLADEPVSAWREPWTVRARRWRARHRPLVAAASAALVVALAAAGWGWKQVEVQATRDRTRGASLVQAIGAAEIGKVPPLVDQLEGFRRWANPLLVALLRAAPDDSPEKLRAALALIPVDPRQADYLAGRLLKASAEELLVIRDALKPLGTSLRPRFWMLLDNGKAGPEDRFRAAAALAAFDPADPRWKLHGAEVVNRLVKVDPQAIAFWTRAFSPARSSLIKPLDATIRDRSRPEAERTIANNLIGAYADRLEDLVDLVQSADPAQSGLLIARLARSPDRAAVFLEQVLQQTVEPPWNDPPLDRAWTAPDPKLARRIDEGQGMLAERFAFCQTTPLAAFVEVANGLRRSGYRPIRIRPYRDRAADSVHVAAVWTRDGRDWQMAISVTADSLRKEDEKWQQQGYRPVDVAGFIGRGPGDTPATLYTGVWVKRTGLDDRAQLNLGMTLTPLQQAIVAHGKQGLVLDTLNLLIEPDGNRSTSAVWVRADPGSDPSKSFVGNQLEYLIQGAGGKLQVDVGLSAAVPPTNPRESETARLEAAERALKANPSNLDALYQRANARYRLGQFEEAIKDYTVLMKSNSHADHVLLYRSRAHASMGRSKEARSDLAEYVNRHNGGIPGDPQAARADAVIGCLLGEGAEAFDRLETTLARNAGNRDFLFYGACAYSEASRTVTDRGYSDRALQLLRDGLASGHDRYSDLERIHDDKDLEPIRTHPGYHALPFPAGYDWEISAVWSKSKTLQSEESHGLLPTVTLDRCRRWAAQGYRPAAIAVVAPRDSITLVAASVWHQPLLAPGARRELVQRQAQAAAALVQLGRAERVWPLLRLASDPSLRTEIIHSLARFDSGARAFRSVVARLRTEPDVSARRALILALGEFPRSAFESRQEDLISKLLAWYRNDPDPGLHSAVDWLLRQKWGHAAELDRIDRELSGLAIPGSRDWYVNTQGQTMAIIRDPGVFTMGTPTTEPGYDGVRAQQLVRFGRSFAIATREVTEAEYKRLLGTTMAPTEGTPGRPMIADWYNAARYCNWLSKQDQIPEDQWCYPKEIKEGMTMPSDFLERTGYRLPTEAEWEYSCRAGTTTSRPFGENDLWLDRYVWCYETLGPDNLHRRAAGQLKPNDLGLFDVLGNAMEWVQDSFDLLAADPWGKARTDSGFARVVSGAERRISRGGSVNAGKMTALSGGRWPLSPTTGNGIRPARTWVAPNLNAVIAKRRQRIRLQGDDASAHYNLGTLLQSAGQFDAAILEHREALRLQPDLTDSTMALAGILWDQGALDEMVAVMKQAVARASANSGLRHRLALALLLAGDREGYRLACAETLERFGRASDWEAVSAARACLLAPDALDDFSIPLEMAEKARQQYMSVVNPYVQGLARYRAGQHAQAVQVLGSAIEADPHWHAHALTRVVLAMAHHRLGHAEEARRWLEKAHDTYGGEAWGVKPGEVIGSSAPWADRAEFQILSREADTLILDPAAATKAVVP